MASLCRGRIYASAAGGPHRDEIRSVVLRDRNHRVVNRDLEDGEAASQVNGGRLVTRGLHDVQELLVPGDGDRAGCATGRRRMGSIAVACNGGGGLGRADSAEDPY